MDYGCTELYVEIRAQLWLMLFSSDYFSKMLTRKKIRYKTKKMGKYFKKDRNYLLSQFVLF